MSKTWFITGTSSGFGRALTGQLLARGDRVAATLRSRQPSTTSRPSTVTAFGWRSLTSPT